MQSLKERQPLVAIGHGVTRAERATRTHIAGMRHRTIVLYVLLVVILAGVLGGGLYSIYHHSSAGSSLSRTATVTVGIVQASVTASGNVSAAESSTLSFASSGTVTAVPVSLGQQVRTGEVLAKIDPTTAQTNLAAAQAALAAAEENLTTAEQGGTAAEKASNAASLESAQSSVTSDEQAVASDQSALSSANAQLAADRALGCPGSAGSASTGTSSSSGSSSSSSGSSGSGTSTGTGSGTTTAHLARTPATAAIAPSVTTGSATGLTARAATLEGTVTPNGADTTYLFEYGTTDAYRLTSPTFDAGSGTTSVSASTTVTGLKANTKYIFRLVATSAVGSATGAGQVFSTEQTSCALDQATITADSQTVQRAETTLDQANASLTSTQASITQSTQTNTATVAQDKATVSEDQATVSTDAKDLAQTTLVSPIDGAVTALSGSVGESVGTSGTVSQSGASSTAAATSSSSGGASSSSGSSSSGFVTVTNLRALQVTSGFAEADATKIAVGQPSTVTFPALPNVEVAGKVTAVRRPRRSSATSSPTTRRSRSINPPLRSRRA